MRGPYGFYWTDSPVHYIWSGCIRPKWTRIQFIFVLCCIDYLTCEGWMIPVHLCCVQHFISRFLVGMATTPRHDESYRMHYWFRLVTRLTRGPPPHPMIIITSKLENAGEVWEGHSKLVKQLKQYNRWKLLNESENAEVRLGIQYEEHNWECTHPVRRWYLSVAIIVVTRNHYAFWYEFTHSYVQQTVSQPVGYSLFNTISARNSRYYTLLCFMYSYRYQNNVSTPVLSCISRAAHVVCTYW